MKKVMIGLVSVAALCVSMPAFAASQSVTSVQSSSQSTIIGGSGTGAVGGYKTSSATTSGDQLDSSKGTALATKNSGASVVKTTTTSAQYSGGTTTAKGSAIGVTITAGGTGAASTGTASTYSHHH